MKTTLNLDDELLRRVKKIAAERGVTMTHLVEEALRRLLDQSRSSSGHRFRWPVVNGTRPPSVDVADRNALYERMEGRA